MNKIEKVIASIRNSHPDMENLYLYGQCYNFFLILREIFGPKVEAWYCHDGGHIYSKIEKYWYDIRGIHYKCKNCSRYIHKRTGDRPHRWGKRDIRKLKKEK